MVGPDASPAGGPIGVISFVSAESGRSFSRRRPRARGGARPPRRHRGRERAACTASARTSRPDAAARPAARRAPARSPACASRACIARPGAENLVGGDFYDAFPTDAGWMLLVGDVTGRGAEAAAADRAGAPHAAHRGPAAVAIPRRRCSSSTETLADRRELTPCTVAIVHVTAQTTEVVLRRPSAARC